MAYGDLKICLEKQFLKKYNVIKHLNLLKTQNIMNITDVLLQWLLHVLLRNLLVLILLLRVEIKFAGGTVKIQIMPNHELGEELHKLIIWKFEKTKTQSSFVDNIWDAHLLISN